MFLELARTEGEGEVKELDEIRAIRATNGFAVELPGGGKTASMVFPSEFSCSAASRAFEIVETDDVVSLAEIARINHSW